MHIRESGELRLGATIDLVHNVVAGVVIPVVACLWHNIWHARDVLRLGDDSDSKTTAQVPGHVTVEWPHTRVVSFHLDHDVAEGGQELCIATGRVGGVLYRAIPDALAGVEHVVIMSVHMEWVNEGCEQC